MPAAVSAGPRETTTGRLQEATGDCMIAVIAPERATPWDTEGQPDMASPPKGLLRVRKRAQEQWQWRQQRARFRHRGCARLSCARQALYGPSAFAHQRHREEVLPGGPNKDLFSGLQRPAVAAAQWSAERHGMPRSAAEARCRRLVGFATGKMGRRSLVPHNAEVERECCYRFNNGPGLPCRRGP